MKRSRFSEEQIISILKEAEAGGSVRELCRRHGIATATYYSWKGKYGGMQVSDVKRLKELEYENARLKQLYAEASMENAALKELLNRKS